MFRVFFLCCQDRAKGTVDLHGLSVPEALEYAKQEFQSATLRADRVVRFIVGTSFNGLFHVCCSQRFIGDGFYLILGKGLHSKAGRAKIRPALENLCDGYVKILNRRVVYAHLGRSGVGIHTLWILGMAEYWLFSVDVAGLGPRIYVSTSLLLASTSPQHMIY